MSPQPYCRHCGKAIAKRTRTVYFVDKLSPHMEKPDSWARYIVGRPTNKDEAKRLVNEEIVSIRRGRMTTNADGYSDVRDDLISHVTTWDGESYVSRLFCMDRHAAAFAYAMLHHDLSLGMPEYHAAVERAGKKERVA